jgi:hypothetical protein
MGKAFSQLTDAEVLNLDNEQLNIAIRLEAIERGVKPPLTLPEALRQSEWRGYERPAEFIRVFRFAESYHRSAFGWLDEAKALAAMEGVVRIEETSYGTPKAKIQSATPTIETVYVGVSNGEHKGAKFEEFFEDTTAFDAIADECVAKVSALRQAAYDNGVNAARKAEYLRLSNGDETIARAFWAKTQPASIVWPE